MKILSKILIALSIMTLIGCGTTTAVSASGVKMATTKVETAEDGTTIEQRNIKERLARDNKPGSIKFLYIVSPFTGDLIISSTVKGKVTSSSKRLTPADLTQTNSEGGGIVQKVIKIDGRWYTTDQNPGDDGTYGDSIQYLFWFDANDVYHQAYIGGAIVHISDKSQTFYKTTQRVENGK
jgi:hypothetical protein